MSCVADTLELRGASRRKAHIANDDGGEGVDDAVGDGSRKDAKKEEQGLWVVEGEQGLLLVEVLVLDANFVRRNALDRDDALPLGQKSSAGCGVRHARPDDDAPKHGGTTESIEDDLPFGWGDGIG